jgi:hypothetical protein
MGWTEEELNATTLTAIETAYRGKVKMLQAVYGDGKKEKPKLTPSQIREGLMDRNGSR